MNPESSDRRRFIKTGLAVPLLTNMPASITMAHAASRESFPVPAAIHDELVRLYGDRANYIAATERIALAAPELAESNVQIPIKVTGEKGWVTSLVLLVEKNPKPVATRCTLLAGVDLDVSFRIRMASSSDIFLVAETRDGLMGVRKHVKYTIGCGEV